ncbi:hypothetical protein K8352_15060 [Flavobacteriaceae bacterium F89]|uniref:DUF6876 domain-containing protein n=1 Tax=Cerina litoralis TaxID=2874477 RepID=A0AAE3JU62_9FLAO|nr:DUF6876 family protein [Cerina litoralis]MCG2462077.1 hypothetical protein [Cerina litoralis]
MKTVQHSSSSTGKLEMNAKRLKSELGSFHGSVTIYKIPLLGTYYTDGIKYLAETAKCFWLVTDVSVIAKSLNDRSPFITIDVQTLSWEEKDLIGYEAIITYSDGNGHILETQKYHLTDFPLDSLRLFFVDNTLLLPSEY